MMEGLEIMYSTRQNKETKRKVNITLHGQLICTNHMTMKQVDKFLRAMRDKGYQLEVTYNA